MLNRTQKRVVFHNQFITKSRYKKQRAHSEPSVNVILPLSSSHSRIWSVIVGGMMGVWKRTRKSKNNKNNTSRPHVSVFVRKSTYFYVPVWRTVHSYPVKTVTENATFQNSLSREKIFENTVLLYLFEWMKTEVFENDYVTVLDISNAHTPVEDGPDGSVTIALGILRYFPCGRAKTIKKHNVRTPIFFFKKKRRKLKFPF